MGVHIKQIMHSDTMHLSMKTFPHITSFLVSIKYSITVSLIFYKVKNFSSKETNLGIFLQKQQKIFDHKIIIFLEKSFYVLWVKFILNLKTRL